MEQRILWAGDSTVKKNTIETYPQTGIGQVLPLYLRPEIQILNYAENGRSTKSFIEEGRLDMIEREIKERDLLFIQFGHNDQKTDLERHTKPYGEYQVNLRKFIEVAKRKGAKPVLITSLYRRHFDENENLKDNVHEDYPDAMKDVAKVCGVACIDLCEKSKQLLQQYGDAKTKEWFMNLPGNRYQAYPDGLVDNTHLRYEGAVIMAGLVAEGLYELGGEYKNLLLNEDKKKVLL
ncbi:rhamnogalacturonan acetylesterase [Candidatus Galacturonibacter soehngenii]|uniref:Rhamnogalacturonan acetylesterase n=1 Tax=Candidatus Galacturonatibacter soehngenii TaxID=2307010 RepID=A0A7V7QIG4_9FIRM|nr:rhamnogalacturonan acetylesterase [Candidatus Galacturonibacter soehngenii]KAB1436017.1 rhamnogalacturonan acetylesterase [Candidatus Galacturonibacter soehngenii]